MSKYPNLHQEALESAGLRFAPEARTHLDLGGEAEDRLRDNPALLTGVVRRALAPWDVDLETVVWHDVMMDVTSWRDGLAPFRWRLVGTDTDGHTVALWSEQMSVREGVRQHICRYSAAAAEYRIEMEGRNASGFPYRHSVAASEAMWLHRPRPAFLPQQEGA